MKIQAVAHAVPDLALTNDQAIALFRRRNRERFSSEQLDMLEGKIRKALKVAGTEKRHITPPGRPVGHLVLKAAEDALADAQISAGEIDLVLYVGIGRGWLEPAMATWVQRELGVRAGTGFDLLDACASWLRGLEIAQAMLHNGRYETVLMVNSEAGMSPFADVTLADEQSLSRAVAIFTLGEAATATVLSRGSSDIYFSFWTYPECFDLCLIPLQNAGSYAPELAARAGDGHFYAESDKLVAATVRRIVDAYRREHNINHGDYDVFFTHSASARAIDIVAAQLGLSVEKCVATHAEYGNTSSAAIPLAMSLALQDGRLKRGDKVLAVAGSAGISVGFASFIF